MMRVKKDNSTLLKIQSNFKTLLVLQDKEFLSKLEDISGLSNCYIKPSIFYKNIW